MSETCHTDFPRTLRARIGKYSNGRSGKIERETGTESAEYLPVRGPKKPSREIGVTGPLARDLSGLGEYSARARQILTAGSHA